MADPVDQILDDIETPTPPATTETPTETVPKEDFDRIKSQLDAINADPVLAQLRENPQLLHDLRARAVEPVPTPPPNTDPNAQFWESPADAVNRQIDTRVAPVAQAIGANMVTLFIQSFKGSQAGDPFFNIVSPKFDAEINQLRSGLATMQPDQMQRLFQTIWDAKVGEYVQKRRAEKAAQPPPNLGGGSGGGGGAPTKKTLAELDPGLYQIAVAGDWTPEQMQQYADELQGE